MEIPVRTISSAFNFLIGISLFTDQIFFQVLVPIFHSVLLVAYQIVLLSVSIRFGIPPDVYRTSIRHHRKSSVVLLREYKKK